MAELEDYVDKIGGLKAKDFKHKDLGDFKGIALKELGAHTENLSQLEEERRLAKIENDPNLPNYDLTTKELCSKANIIFVLLVLKVSFTGVLVPLFDMASDLAAAIMHFIVGNVAWGILTLLFVWLPGFVVALAITIRGLNTKFTVQRLVNYLIFLVGFPILYPAIQVLVNAYMLYLMLVNRSKEIVSIMGHDVKQFKSLEGFLESGPQFVLQSYILLRGEEKYEDLEQAKARLIATLVISITLSFLSLTKTGFNVNCPDSDDKRKSKQNPENSRYFKITSLLFHFVCVLFRISCLSYFFAVFRAWTTIIIVGSIAVNFVLLHFNGASYTMSVILGTVSIFMPNGYLLYNFAATFLVDFTFKETKNFLLYHMLTITPAFILCLLVILISGTQDADWLLDNTENTTLSIPNVMTAFNATLLVLGFLSLVLCFVHWKFSILPLYSPLQNEDSHKEHNCKNEED